MNLHVWRKVGRTLLTVALLCGCGAFVAIGAPQYGTLVVEQGSVTLIRDGKAQSHSASPSPVTVNEQDIVRVREGSKATLTTSEQAKVVFGANAIFHCKPWQAANRTGVLSLLYGRLRASVQGLGPERSFNLRTLESVVGVKGTEYGLIQTNGGGTMVLGIESTVTLTGSDNEDQSIGPDHFASVAPGQPATPSFEAPTVLKQAIASLDAPPANSPKARDLPAFQFTMPLDRLDPYLDDAQHAGARRQIGIIINFNP